MTTLLTIDPPCEILPQCAHRRLWKAFNDVQNTRRGPLNCVVQKKAGGRSETDHLREQCIWARLSTNTVCRRCEPLPLSPCARMWQTISVKLWSVFRCLLPTLAVVGMLIAPLAVPATAALADRAAMTDMADGMPCCPEEGPAIPDCGKSCPLMMICLAKCLQNIPPAASTLLVPLVMAGLFVPGNDALGASLLHPPPARPPRI